MPELRQSRRVASNTCPTCRKPPGFGLVARRSDARMNDGAWLWQLIRGLGMTAGREVNEEGLTRTVTRQSEPNPLKPEQCDFAGVPLPPPPPGVRYVRIPVVQHVVVADDVLRDRIERYFHWPMIVLALAILPLLAWEFLWPPESGTWQWWASAISLVVIWLAFFIEFSIKVAIAECRWEYARKNWLDIVVLCLPLLRPLRVATVARTSRVYALRGVGMKLLRYGFTLVVGLEMTDRLLGRIGVKKERGLDPQSMTRFELIKELRRRRAEVAAWESWYADYQAYYHRVLADEASREAADDDLVAGRGERVTDDDDGDTDETPTRLARLKTADHRPSPVLPAIRLVRPPDTPPTGPQAASSTDRDRRATPDAKGSAAGDHADPHSAESYDDESPGSRQSTA